MRNVRIVKYSIVEEEDNDCEMILISRSINSAQYAVIQVNLANC